MIRSSVSHSGHGHNSRCGERIKLILADEMNVRKKKESPKVESDKTKKRGFGNKKRVVNGRQQLRDIVKIKLSAKLDAI